MLRTESGPVVGRELIFLGRKRNAKENKEMANQRYEPIDSGITPRFAGHSSFMRLPVVANPNELDIAIVGVPWDGGTTNRAGPRHGPRQVREMSSLIRRVHAVTKVSPYELCRIADMGDAPVNPVDLDRSLESIAAFFSQIVQAGVVPLGIGGDHLSSLPILRAVASQRPVGMVHFDAHSDTVDTYFGGSKYTHGTPFRRAIEEKLLDPKRVVQIGIRGSTYSTGERDWPIEQGIRMISIDEFEDLGINAVLGEARRVVGKEPTYITFDIDSLDPAYAPGTGTPEFGGLTSREANRLLRGLRGLNLVGADVVEVSPPFDPSGGTALAAANIAFELLCLLAEGFAEKGAAERNSRGQAAIAQ
jgi:guanidinopropionase